jgi:hypothetical protein
VKSIKDSVFLDFLRNGAAAGEFFFVVAGNIVQIHGIV